MDTEKRLETSSIMKYFTPYWYGDIPYKEVIRIRDSYWEYIENISEKLPFTVRILAKNINLHDAILQQFSYDITKKNVYVSYLGGDLQVGYFILECTYTQVDHCQSDHFFIGKQILSDEIELLESRFFCQRFLFTDYSETEIVFKELSLSITESTSEKYLEIARKSKKLRKR